MINNTFINSLGFGNFIKVSNYELKENEYIKDNLVYCSLCNTQKCFAPPEYEDMIILCKCKCEMERINKLEQEKKMNRRK